MIVQNTNGKRKSKDLSKVNWFFNLESCKY